MMGLKKEKVILVFDVIVMGELVMMSINTEYSNITIYTHQNNINNVIYSIINTLKFITYNIKHVQTNSTVLKR